MPAGTELRTSGAFFSATGDAASFFGAGVMASLKGCAAAVDVAGGGVRDEDVLLAETVVALRRVGAVKKAREAARVVGVDIRAREAARRQVRQIIVEEVRGQCMFGGRLLAARLQRFGRRICFAEAEELRFDSWKIILLELEKQNWSCFLPMHCCHYHTLLNS